MQKTHTFQNHVIKCPQKRFQNHMKYNQRANNGSSNKCNISYWLDT